jgi:hypothetical protein
MDKKKSSTNNRIINFNRYKINNISKNFLAENFKYLNIQATNLNTYLDNLLVILIKGLKNQNDNLENLDNIDNDYLDNFDKIIDDINFKKDILIMLRDKKI